MLKELCHQFVLWCGRDGRLNVHSDVHREKQERVSWLKTICERKEIKFDILDSVRFLRNTQADRSIFAYVVEELRIGLESKWVYVSCQNILLLKEQMECNCDCLQRI